MTCIYAYFFNASFHLHLKHRNTWIGYLVEKTKNKITHASNVFAPW